MGALLPFKYVVHIYTEFKIYMEHLANIFSCILFSSDVPLI